MTDGGREVDPAGANKLLACFAGLLYIMAGFALYRNRSAGLIGTLAFLGVLVSAMSAFEPRMVGEFILGQRGAKFNLVEKKLAMNSVFAAESELRLNELIPLAEVVAKDE